MRIMKDSRNVLRNVSSRELCAGNFPARVSVAFAFVLLFVSLACVPSLKLDNVYDPLAMIGHVTNHNQDPALAADPSGLIRITGPVSGEEGAAQTFTAELTGWPSDSIGTVDVVLSAQSTIVLNGVEFTSPTDAITFDPPVLTFTWGTHTDYQIFSVTAEDRILADRTYRIEAKTGPHAASADVVMTDNDLIAADLSAGQGVISGQNPSAVLDTVNGKLLIATESGTSQFLSIYNCDPDGTNCAHTDVSGVTGQGVQSGRDPTLILDLPLGKLIVTTRSTGGVSIYRCNLDVSGCTHTLLAGSANSNLKPLPLIDPMNNRLLIASSVVPPEPLPADYIYKADIAFCARDASDCGTSPTIVNDPGGVGQNIFSKVGFNYDAANGKIILGAVTGNNAYVTGFSAVRCNPDITGCTVIDISALAGAVYGLKKGVDMGRQARPIIDTANGRILYLVFSDFYGTAPVLYSCSLDFTNCFFSNISRGSPSAYRDVFLAAALDPGNNKVFVAGISPVLDLYLTRFNLDGSDPEYVNLTPDSKGDNVVTSMVVDEANGRVLVIGQNLNNGTRLQMHSVPLDYTR